jgi:hypothetical protein
MARTEIARDDLLKLIIEEVDEARDIHALAVQLLPHLPIRSFDELVKATAGKEMRFRDMAFDVESLRDHIPSIAFPVQDAAGLVERLGHIVRVAPPHLGVDVTTPAGARRQMRFMGVVSPGLEIIQGRRNSVATTVSPLGHANVAARTNDDMQRD